MAKTLRLFLLVQFAFVLYISQGHASVEQCAKVFNVTKSSTVFTPEKSSFLSSIFTWMKKHAINYTLNFIGYMKGLPEYLKRSQELQESGRYLEYANFGEMGLAELGISVKFNKQKLESLNNGNPVIIVANHHLGIADGLALQNLSSKARKDSPSLLFLARWIEKLFPKSIFGDEKGWGTAAVIEINLPSKLDSEYEKKMAMVKNFNSSWNRKTIKVLKKGGALIIFPAGHVASINDDGSSFPKNVYDAPGSWQDSFLSLARLGKADIVFANVDSVNSEAFYIKRKRFGGGDKERVIWFFGEAIDKKDEAIDVYLSQPMSIDEIYNTLSHTFNKQRAELEANLSLTAELMRQYTYKVKEMIPQELNTMDSPQKISE